LAAAEFRADALNPESRIALLASFFKRLSWGSAGAAEIGLQPSGYADGQFWFFTEARYEQAQPSTLPGSGDRFVSFDR
jgi:hypothetical protein